MTRLSLGRSAELPLHWALPQPHSQPLLRWITRRRKPFVLSLSKHGRPLSDGLIAGITTGGENIAVLMLERVFL